MLPCSFVHLPGVGVARERSLWESGIIDWDAFLAEANSDLLPAACRTHRLLIRQSVEALANGDIAFFGGRLPHRELWRLYTSFAKRALFLDIETTGLSPYHHEVTMIGALSHGKPALFINGINLDLFPAFVEQFPLLVTFNGSQFDVPFLRVHFPHARLDQVHIDLRFVLGALGYRGGLKAIEKRLALNRDAAIDGVDGFEAVRLWHRYRNGDHAALRKLALYSLTDVVNLVDLIEIAVSEKARRASFPVQYVPGASNSAVRPGAELLSAWLQSSAFGSRC